MVSCTSITKGTLASDSSIHLVVIMIYNQENRERRWVSMRDCKVCDMISAECPEMGKRRSKGTCSNGGASRLG